MGNLGTVEKDIRILEVLLVVVSRSRLLRLDSDADCQVLAFHGRGNPAVLDGRHDLQDDAADDIPVFVLDDEEELIPAEAEELRTVLRNSGLHGLRYFLQAVVPDQMAELVVVGFEAIDIEEDEGDIRIPEDPARRLDGEVGLRPLPVLDSGQAVRDGEERVLAGFPFRFLLVVAVGEDMGADKPHAKQGDHQDDDIVGKGS